MQSPDTLAAKLTDILEREADALDRMQAAMAKNRTAFVAIDAGRLDDGVADLEQSWHAIEQLESSREQAATELSAALEVTGRPRVSRFVEALSGPAAKRLRTAADNVDAASRRVRAETTAGARLLSASRQVNEAVVHALLGAPIEDVPGYDSRANRTGGQTKRGSLITGSA